MLKKLQEKFEKISRKYCKFPRNTGDVQKVSPQISRKYGKFPRNTRDVQKVSFHAPEKQQNAIKPHAASDKICVKVLW